MMSPQTGNALWAQLHLVAKQTTARQEVFFPVWMDRVKFNLGCVSCGKKLDWFCKLWPVAYGKEFWLWSICLHDYVNKEMGRPLFHPDLTLAPLRSKGLIQ